MHFGWTFARRRWPTPWACKNSQEGTCRGHPSGNTNTKRKNIRFVLQSITVLAIFFVASIHVGTRCSCIANIPFVIVPIIFRFSILVAECFTDVMLCFSVV